MDDEASSGKKGSLSAIHIAGIIACVGLLTGLALLTRRVLSGDLLANTTLSRRVSSLVHPEELPTAGSSMPDQQAANATVSTTPNPESLAVEQKLEPTAALAKTWFDQLLGNQLPLREEAAEFPKQISLQGRIDVVLRQDAEHVIVEVKDHGIGIGPNDLSKIFDPYFRAQFSDTQTRRGAGLGLTLVQQIASAHGGRAEVESELGKGSTFRLLFPRLKPEEMTAIPGLLHAPEAL